jgi:biopolymer transport protein ExbD
MKKISQSHHHSLSELNITPLLDLAFVLLVIFIITTTPMVNDLDLNLPTASSRPKDAPKKPNYVTVSANGKIYLNMKEVDLIALHQLLVQLREQDPDLSVVVRGDSKIQYQNVVNVLDILQQANVTKVGLATEPVANAAPK